MKMDSAMRAGRLSITCIEARHVRTRADHDLDESALSPYLVFELKSGDASLRTQSKPGHNKGHDVDFKQNVVSLDLEDPSQFLRDGSVVLSVKLQFDSLYVGLIGEAKLSIDGILTAQTSTEFIHDLKVLRPGDQTTNCEVTLKFLFTPARVGMLKLYMHHLALAGVDNRLKVLASTPDGQSKSCVLKDITGNDSMDFWIDDKNWFGRLAMIFHEEGDEDKSMTVEPLSLIDFGARVRGKVMSSVPAISRGIKSPTMMDIASLDLHHEFMEAGQVWIESIELSNLPADAASNLSNLRMILTSKGKVHRNKLTTDSPKNNEGNLLWDDAFMSIPIVDEYTMLVQCCEYDEVAGDYEAIGMAELSLLPLFRDGRIETTADLKHLTELGDALDAGVLRIAATFDPPKGVAFPQDQPTMTSYTYNRPEDTDKEEEKEIQTIEEDDDGVYTEEDTKKAFHCFDLDKNGYIGASELRHLLIFMGEHVTFEEVDMMISMLDVNGDGQVSYKEFKAMVQSEDPSQEDFLSEQYNKQAIAVEAQQKKTLTAKKLEVFARVINAYNVDTIAVVRMWDILRSKAFKDPTNVTSSSFYVGYEEFCQLMPVMSTTSESHLMYDLIRNGESFVDGRELIMSFSNFVGFTNEDKCRLAFELFDIDRSGFLSIDEIEALLVATHLKTKDAIAKRAETLMRSADSDGSGDVCIDELIVASEKFPNILFPNHISPPSV